MSDTAPTAVGGRPDDTRAGYLSVLANREFRAVFAAEILAILGLVVTMVTLAVLIYERTASPLLSALSFAAGFLPYLVGASLFSAVTDRFRARGLLVGAQSASAAVMAIMAVPHTPVVVLLGLLLVNGTIAPLVQGARAAAVADILSPAGFPLGRSLLRMAAQTAQIAGLAFGGTLLLAVSTETALLASAAALLASAVLLRVGMRDRPARAPGGRGSGGAPSIARESLEGAREAFRLPLVRPLLLLSWLPAMLAVTPEALAAPYAERLGGGSLTVALLLSATPVGMVVGEVLAGTLVSAERRVRWMVPCGLLVFAPMLALAADPPLAVVLPLLVVCGVGFAYTLGLDQILLEAIPAESRGRILTVASAGLMVTQGIGFTAAGAVAEFAPPHAVVVGAGVCGVGAVLYLGRRHLPGRRRLAR